MPTTLIDNYRLKSGSPDNVVLTVTIGFAQLGTTTVSIDGKPILANAVDENGNPIQADANGEYPMSFKLSIGKNTALVNKKLVLVAAVERIQDVSDWTSVTVKLQGGAQVSTYPVLKQKISTKGDWLTYVAVITFTA